MNSREVTDPAMQIILSRGDKVKRKVLFTDHHLCALLEGFFVDVNHGGFLA